MIILALAVAVAWTNYRPGTVLSGWDNLHPEFGFDINLKRSLFAVWQEYQGLGLLGGMGHASDLIRQIFLYLISPFIPVQFIRYFFHFLMLFVGPLGLYHFLFYLIPSRHVMRKWGALAGALYYLFNLATVQMFNVPFEPYSVHYAFLPWLLYSTVRFFRQGGFKNFLGVALINFLAVPQSYIGTFFLVYCLSLSLLAVQFFNRKYLRRIIVLFLTVFIVNAFWLLPNIYFIVRKIEVNTQAKINRMSTEDMFLRNKKFGDLENVLLLRGFWFDNTEINTSGGLEYQLQDWLDYLKDPRLQTVGFIFPLLAIIGCYYAYSEKKGKSRLLLPLVVFSFSILANDAPFFSYLAGIFNKIPLFSQVFRFPFTKLSILHITGLAVFYGIGSLWLSEKVLPFRKINLLMILLIFLPVFYCLPVFSGRLFYYKVRAEIPREYFDLFNYFKKVPSTDRIANFPQYTFWGWTFYRFNYSGSGFIWYGLEQPVMDRAFDVWSREDENYFHEISYAIYSRNLYLFEQTLQKYKIKWVLFDGNVISFSNSRELYRDRLQTLISSSAIIRKDRTFGRISLYRVETTEENIRLTDILPGVSPDYISGNLDMAYLESGDYKSDDGKRIDADRIHYPFRSLFSDTSNVRHEFTITETEEDYIFTSVIPGEFRNQELRIPPTDASDFLEIDSRDLSKTTAKNSDIYLDSQILASVGDKDFNNGIVLPDFERGILEVKIPKIKGYYSFDSYLTDSISSVNPFTCEKPDPELNIYERIIEFDKPFLRMTSRDGIYCLNYETDRLSHQLGYLVRVESRNISGKSLYFGIINNNSKRSDLEVMLPRKDKLIPSDFDVSYLIIPPMENYALGYLFNIRNISIGRQETANDIGRITVNPIPYNFLSELKLVKPGQKRTTIPLNDITVVHPHPDKYLIEFNEIPDDTFTLILAQSFDDGWKLYARDQNGKKEVGRHLKVNNWENGWEIDGRDFDGGKLEILYRPQNLEKVGMYLWLVLPLIFLLYYLKNRRESSVHKR